MTTATQRNEAVFSSDWWQAPAKNLRWARAVLPRSVHPYLRGLRRMFVPSRRPREEPFRSVYYHTQMSQNRQRFVYEHAAALDERGVEGAIVECGVLDGGSAALMAHATRRTGRPVHLFDAWQGLPRATEPDGVEAQFWSGHIVGSPRRVLKVMKRMRIEPARVTLHHGWFNETFPTADVPIIAMLNIDCDFYEPTRLCLERWLPHMAPGGIIHIDDYAAFAGCRTAVDEFLQKRPDLSLDTWGVGGTAYYIAMPEGITGSAGIAAVEASKRLVAGVPNDVTTANPSPPRAQQPTVRASAPSV